jgi:hypothetical protein
MYELIQAPLPSNMTPEWERWKMKWLVCCPNDL